ncbi:MAG TPA: DinB family protein [Thermoanaerobaculia bacterium]|nr:DinB family protein [Thermoanaerobaculia bacterium]
MQLRPADQDAAAARARSAGRRRGAELNDLLVALLDQAFDRPSWHGTNLRGALRRLDPERAAWRPGPRRHNAWELIVHCAYWKYTVWRRFDGAARGSFSLPGSDWFERPIATTAEALRGDVALLEEWHAKLRATVAAAEPAVFARATGKGRFTVRELVTGAAAHDLYHAGQIQLLKRLHGERR